MPTTRAAEVSIRPVTIADAEELAAVLLANAAFLQPWSPARDASWYTLESQRAITARDEDRHHRGEGLHHVVLAGGRIVGRVDLSNVVRGVWQNATIGYWIAEDACGNGYATAAVRAAVTAAFGAGLHRVQAGVMPRNAASLHVLAKCGFRPEGRALRYLRINGAWEDHDIFAVTAEEWTAPSA